MHSNDSFSIVSMHLNSYAFSRSLLSNSVDTTSTAVSTQARFLSLFYRQKQNNKLQMNLLSAYHTVQKPCYSYLWIKIGKTYALSVLSTTLTLFCFRNPAIFFFTVLTPVKVFHMPHEPMAVWWAAYLQQAVATAALPQGLGGGWDHVLLLLSHSQRELAQHNTDQTYKGPLSV